jgi:hypothetical protein
MPRDTPPPIPKDMLDEWYAKRRAKRNARAGNTTNATNANHEPLQGNRLGDRTHLPERPVPAPAPVVEARTVYESAPIVRNLQQEAVRAFVPSVVRTKLDKGHGKGGLLEPEEADQLEQEGYLKRSSAAGQQEEEEDDDPGLNAVRRNIVVEDVEDEE